MTGRLAFRRSALAWVLLAVASLPASADADPMAGVQVEALARGAAAQVEGYALQLLRITMEPGAEIAPHSHPGTVVLIVEDGRFGTTFTRGEGTVTRSGQEGSAISAEEDAVLEPGDGLAYDGTAAHTMRNAGDEPLVLVVAALLESGEAGFLFHD